jgi:anthranilate synthase component 1
MSGAAPGGLRPSLEEFVRLAKEYSVVPVWRELLGDLETPVSAFRKLGGAEGSVLLESVEHGERWGRYSFIGTDPFATFSARNGRVTWTGDPPHGLPQGPPLALLRAALERLRSPAIPELAPLYAGAIGYLAYDAVRELERLPDQTTDDLELPDALLVLPRSVVVFDHLGQRLALVANVLVNEAVDLEEAYAAAARRLDDLAGRLAVASPTPTTPLPAAGPPAKATSDLPAGRYQRMVEIAKEHIRAGDIFQVVPSQRFSVPTTADPFDVYRVLRVVNPSPYMYFLRLPGVTLAGSSPEVLVTVQGRNATMRPIAGTRPRGADSATDLGLEEELKADEKERAEHVMLVDLARNDLGRVCRPGTVRVSELMRVERYSHVMHLVSDVVGELADGVTPFDVLAASFPAGTVSGRPRCGPWRSSTTWSATAAAPTPAASATSTSPATSIPASPSAPACSSAAPPTARPAPGWWPIRSRTARSARPRRRRRRCWPRSRPPRCSRSAPAAARSARGRPACPRSGRERRRRRRPTGARCRLRCWCWPPACCWP